MLRDKMNLAIQQQARLRRLTLSSYFKVFQSKSTYFKPKDSLRLAAPSRPV
jgi:hypothetical protein